MHIRQFAVAALLAVPLASLAQTPVDVKVRVVDAAGSPVVGARVSQAWFWEGGKFNPGPSPMVTGASGEATGKVDLYGRPFGLVAIDAESKRGGFVVVAPADAAKLAVVKIAPLQEVRFASNVKDWAGDPPRLSYSITAESGEMLFMTDGPALALPPGRYKLNTFSFDTARREPLAFTVGNSPANVALDLEMSTLARAVGKSPPPLNITESVGLPAGFKLGDYKGKWVYLEYWGYW